MNFNRRWHNRCRLSFSPRRKTENLLKKLLLENIQQYIEIEHENIDSLLAAWHFLCKQRGEMWPRNRETEMIKCQLRDFYRSSFSCLPTKHFPRKLQPRIHLAGLVHFSFISMTISRKKTFWKKKTHWRTWGIWTEEFSFKRRGKRNSFKPPMFD